MTDSNNVHPIRLDATYPRQTEDAALATLEHAERVLQQITKLREDHVNWYRRIQDTEQASIDAIVAEAAAKVVPEHIATSAVALIDGLVVDNVVKRCFEQLMMYADMQELKRIGKLVRALTALIKGK